MTENFKQLSMPLESDNQSQTYVKEREDSKSSTETDQEHVYYDNALKIGIKKSNVKTADEIFGTFDGPKKLGLEERLRVAKKESREQNRLLMSTRIQEQLDFAKEKGALRQSVKLERHGASTLKGQIAETLDQMKQIVSAVDLKQQRNQGVTPQQPVDPHQPYGLRKRSPPPIETKPHIKPSHEAEARVALKSKIQKQDKKRYLSNLIQHPEGAPAQAQQASFDSYLAQQRTHQAHHTQTNMKPKHGEHSFLSDQSVIETSLIKQSRITIQPQLASQSRRNTNIIGKSLPENAYMQNEERFTQLSKSGAGSSYYNSMSLGGAQNYSKYLNKNNSEESITNVGAPLSNAQIQMMQYGDFSQSRDFNQNSEYLNIDSSPFPGNLENSIDSSATFITRNPHVLQKFINYENKFNQAFCKSSPKDSLTASSFNTIGGSAKMRKTRIGQMMSRQVIQQNMEFRQVQDKALYTGQNSLVKLSDGRQLVKQQFQTVQPNVLGTKSKHLDLLEDQRNEIERIVRKKKRQLRNLESTPEKAQPKTTGFSTIQSVAVTRGTSNYEIPDLKGLMQISDEITQTSKKQGGGGFFSPAGSLVGLHNEHGESGPMKSAKMIRIISNQKEQPPLILPQISNMTAAHPDRFKTTKKARTLQHQNTKIQHQMQKNGPKGGQPNRIPSIQPKRPVENDKINKIMNNNTEIERTLSRNPSFNKRDRLYEFQADFEKKMERMNKELQDEIEAEADDLRQSEENNANCEHGITKQKPQIKAAPEIKSITNRETTPPKAVLEVIREVVKTPGVIAEAKERIAPVYLKSQNRTEKMIYHKVQESIDSGTIVEVNSEDWLEIARSNEGSEEFRETETFRKLDANEELVRLYTPPAGHDHQDYDAVLEKLLELKQKQRKHYSQKDKDALPAGKDADHLTHCEMETVAAGYMPAIEKMQKQLQALDSQEKPRRSGQVAQIKLSASNADTSQIKEEAIQSFIDRIKNQSEFYGIAKHVNSPMIDMKQQVDPKARFYLQCQEDGVVALPTLSKIHGKVLNLSGYSMNWGICQALGKAFILYNDILNKLFLESTGTDDKMFAAILEGLAEQTNFKAVTYKKNQLDSLSVRCLLRLLARPLPHNLDELRIINCRISKAALHTLMSGITQSNIRRLSLVAAGIAGKPARTAETTTEEGQKAENGGLFDKILTLLQKSRSLVELDISWNRLGPDNMLDLLQILSNNRQLQSLNISWNHVQDDKVDNEAQSRRKLKQQLLSEQIRSAEFALRDHARQQLSEAKREGHAQEQGQLEKNLNELEEQLAQVKEQERHLTEPEEKVLANLGKFIKHNRSLQQLDLSHTQLGPNLLREICITLRKAKSLLTLDVSGNLGVEPQDGAVREFISKRIRSKPDPYDLERLNQIQEFVLDVNKNYDSKALKNERILTSMQMKSIRSITSTAATNKISNIKTFQANEHLIYQRILGHKAEMPGSAQWIETSTATAPAEVLNDWVSDKSIYTLVFWSKNSSRASKKSSPYSQTEIGKLHSLLKPPDIKKIAEHMLTLKNRPVPMPYIEESQLIFPKDRVDAERIPLFAGSLNNWQYAPMYKIEDFLGMLDPGYLDPLEDMIELARQDRSRPMMPEKLTGLDPRELRGYVQHRFKLLKTMQQNWSHTLMNRCLRYKNPCFINLTEFDEFPTQSYLSRYEDVLSKAWNQDAGGNLSTRKNVGDINELLRSLPDGDDLYVGVTLARPGRHTYVVKYADLPDAGAVVVHDHSASATLLSEEHFSLHRCIIQAREETIPPFVIQSRSNVQQRVFKKETSVFRDWREDREHVYDSCFKADTSHWKVHRLIKNVEDYTACEELLRANFARLKKIFLVQASKSNFPTINWISSADYIRDCQCLDTKVVQTTVDRLFIATNQELEKSDANPANALERYEFLEFLARIAEKKFKETNICDTYVESLEKLLEEHIFKLGDKEEWQEFRDNRLWTIDVNDVLEANLGHLTKIYQKYFAPRKKYMDMKDALEFMMRDSSLNLIEKDAIFCYGMSKMTVDKEHEKHDQYLNLAFVEFLEMIGRIADIKFRRTTLGDEPLAKRIEFVLDDMIPEMLDCDRNPVNIRVEEVSESDDDY